MSVESDFGRHFTNFIHQVRGFILPHVANPYFDLKTNASLYLIAIAEERSAEKVILLPKTSNLSAYWINGFCTLIVCRVVFSSVSQKCPSSSMGERWFFSKVSVQIRPWANIL